MPTTDKTNLGRFLHRGGASKRSSGMMMAGCGMREGGWATAAIGVGSLSHRRAGGSSGKMRKKKKKMG